MPRLSLLLSPSLLTGCVSPEKHHAVVDELQNTRAAADARGRALNRRIEIAQQPDLELLPALGPLASRD